MIEKKLQNGATNEQLINLQEILGVDLPLDFVAFYRIHNGQYPYSEGLVFGEELLCIERILYEWNIWKDLVEDGIFDAIQGFPDQGIKDNWYNLKWIPITSDGSGNNYCLDLDPALNGNYGQVIRIWHDDSIRTLEANSFQLFVDSFMKKGSI